MGLFGFFRRRAKHGLDELAARLGVTVELLAGVPIEYHEFHIAKRSGGGTRRILAPSAPLKSMQRRILRRLLALLVTHDACLGFERGRSIVHHASAHCGRGVVVRLDIRDFFGSTRSERLLDLFRRLRWDDEAATRLIDLCTHGGVLPQGAPTSPRLANLVNFKLDARLAGIARAYGGTYTRYADDLTFSFDHPWRVDAVAHTVRRVVKETGYALNRRKQSIRPRQHRQVVCGLVVNDRVNLPRDIRRRLRAVEHRLASGGDATLTEVQMQGWRALRRMIESQRA